MQYTYHARTIFESDDVKLKFNKSNLFKSSPWVVFLYSILLLSVQYSKNVRGGSDMKQPRGLVLLDEE